MDNFTMVKQVYFIGIGGIGMSALARYFAHQGIPVAGYDRTPTELTNEMVDEGMQVHFQDRVSLIPQLFRDDRAGTLVVYTPAVPADHAELKFFRASGFKVVKRAQALGEIAKTMRPVAVAGTHGKTSTSTLLAHLLNQTGGGCDAFLGGISRNFGSNLVIGNRGANLMVVEADEYDRSFLSLFPYLAIVTSVDSDHLDIYGTYEQVLSAFRTFISQIQQNGSLVLKEGLDLAPAQASSFKTFTYGFGATADFNVQEIEIRDGLYHFNLNTPGGIVKNLLLGAPGRYNLENAIGASAAALLIGITHEELREGLATFAGVERRFDVRYKGQGILYIDDYAHHPEELRATIESARELFPGKRITGIFQPHLYSRTRDFAREFAGSLDLLDVAVLLDIYPARELPIEGISASTVLELMKNPHRYLLSKAELPDWLRAQPLEILITMGAGDIDKLVPEIVSTLKSSSSR